jgi:hypothetical protein
LSRWALVTQLLQFIALERRLFSTPLKPETWSPGFQAFAFQTGPLVTTYAKATYFALKKTYGFLSPELWRETAFTKPPAQEFTDFLSMKKEIVHKVQDEY